MDVEHKFDNVISSQLYKPLMKLDDDKVVGKLHIKRDIVEGTDITAYHELTIKQAEVDLKDELLVSCAASGCFGEEAPKYCEYETKVEHMKTHSGEKLYLCDICEYKAAHKGSLVSHMKMHTGEKPYARSICQYKAARKSRLTNHIKMHTGEKPYAHSICQCEAARKSRLTNHIKMHTGEKPYARSICQYKAARKSRLTNHIKMHTGEKPYACSICEYKTTQSPCEFVSLLLAQGASSDCFAL